MKTTGNETGYTPLFNKDEARNKFPTMPTDEVSKDSKGGTERMKHTLYERLPKELRDEFQFICSRVRDEALDPTRPKILWLHDMWNDPEAQHLKEADSRKRFQKLVFVSDWQLSTYNMLLGVPYGESVVLKNAIDPIPEHKKPKDGPIRLIYHTTPHRGLEILVPTFAHIYENFTKDIHLDVFSGFDIYGSGWANRNDRYKEVFDLCDQHPGITNHGVVDNDVVRKALEEAHIFAYPSIWPETSCIAAIEAMSARCHVVCPNFAALPETCANFAHMYFWDEDPQRHANHFAWHLSRIIELCQQDNDDDRLKFQKTYFDVYYNWDMRIAQWTGMLDSILKRIKVSV